jgi:cysteine desulfurase / selenocysteine lyase
MKDTKIVNPEIIKKDFPIFSSKINGKELVYLDNSATTQKPQVVIDSIINFYTTQNANVHRGVHTLSEIASLEFEKAHYTVAEFIGAKASEIIFTSGTTHSLNILSRALGKSLKEGDEIVVSIMEHHSNFVCWQQIAKEKGAILRIIPITEKYELNMAKANELITNKTKIVAMTHVSNTLGTINPVRTIADLAHKVGAVLVLDAAQSVCHISVDVKKLDCDFLAFSGHKICGPTGIGVLYGKKELLKTLEPVEFGGGMIREVTLQDSTWNDLPYKFEPGTPNIAGAIGLAKAIEYVGKIGMGNIQEHGTKISEYVTKKFSQIKGVKIIGPVSVEKRVPVFSFSIDGIHSHDVGEILNHEGIAIRGGTHCTMPLMKSLGISGTSRASFFIYNSTKDVDALCKGIQKVQEVFK